MSWKATAYIKGLRTCPNGEAMTRSEKLVGLVLADSHQDRGKAYTYPSVDGLAEDSLMSKRECQRTLASLERKGVILRVRPPVQYRGITTYYQIPALDGEGCQPVTLPAPIRATEGRSEGGRKDDTSRTALKDEQELEQKQMLLTPTPSRMREGGSVVVDPDIVAAIETVSKECSFKAKRVLAMVGDVIRLELPTPAADTARTLIEAWKNYQNTGDLLKFLWGPVKFFGEGHWRSDAAWPFDQERLRRWREARVGMR